MMRWVFATLFLGSIILSYALHPLPMTRTDSPGVRHVADLPDGPHMASIQYSLDNYGLILPTPGTLDPRQPQERTRPAVGFAYRQVSMIGLPFYAYEGRGLVLYSRSAGRIDIYPLGDRAIEAVEREGRLTLPRDYRFPFWLHIWGWAVVALGLAWGWWELQDIERRKEAAGII